MKFTAKNITSYILSLFVLGCTLIALLAIWDIISLEDVMRKILTSLLVVFAASVVTLFIYNVLIKDSKS